jgi:hypothetical protein
MNSFIDATGMPAWTAATNGCCATSETGAKVLLRIVWKMAIDRWRKREMAVAAEQQGIAVGRRSLGGDRHARRAAGAAAVIDHDGLPPRIAESLPDDARDDVGAPARGRRHDHADRFTRVVAGRGARWLWCLRECQTRGRERHGGRKCAIAVAGHVVAPAG